jgi:protein-S-isoprenylcysteine O-methyltransferase Ste14
MSRHGLIVTILSVYVVGYVLLRFAGPPWTWLRLMGLALAIVGLVLVTVARMQLGQAFSLTPQARVLVTRGIYSKVRHPVYIFSAVALAGLAIYAGAPRLLPLLIILLPLQMARARAEERVLEAKFGDAYRAYKRQTWF